jgi:hypothetical protein
MLVLLRIIFGVALLYGFYLVRQNAVTYPESGDLMNAFYLAVCVALGILNALAWAPYFGAKLSDPLTTTITTGIVPNPNNRLLRLVRWCERHRYRRCLLCLCFLEAVRHPDSPTAIVIGLKFAPPGSWWQKVYALAVFDFNNTQNCVAAYQVLKGRGIEPNPHPNPEIRLVLQSLERPFKPEAARLEVPPAPPPSPPKRNPLIRLFDAAPSPPPPGAREAAAAPETVRDPATNVPPTSPRLSPGQAKEGE